MGKKAAIVSKMKISIIIPIFNAEAYLKQCIQSVIGQTYNDWELLLVNDGSTDSSGTICDEYAICDNRIRAIHKENTGVSDTRNVGLDLAQGEFIIFLDADDYWYANTALGTLVYTADEYNLDIVRGEYKAVDKDGNDLFERPLLDSKRLLAHQLLTSGQFYTQIMCGENFLVLSLFRRSAIGNLIFNPNRSFLEDMEFYAYLLLQPLRCMFVPIRFYAYRKINISASNTPKIKNLLDSFSMCDIFYECMKRAEDEELRDAFNYNSIMMYHWTLETLASDAYYNHRISIIKDFALAERQKNVLCWAKNDNHHYPLSIYITPYIGVRLLRYVNKTKGYILAQGSKCKRLIKNLSKYSSYC